jgi:hypothetical protein
MPVQVTAGIEVAADCGIHDIGYTKEHYQARGGYVFRAVTGIRTGLQLQAIQQV